MMLSRKELNIRFETMRISDRMVVIFEGRAIVAP
jgi:hypothetical protein